MTTIQIWKLGIHNSERLQANELSSLDAATSQLPEGLYTTFRTYSAGRRAIGFKAHLRRLYQPSGGLGIRPAIQSNEIGMRIGELLPSNTESRVRLILSRAGDFYAIIERLVPLGVEIYEKGIAAITIEGHRNQPGLKLTDFISASEKERQAVKEADAFEGLLVLNRRILEGLTSNFFYIRGQTVGTAKYGVLPGVTRSMVLRILKDSTLLISYRALRTEKLSEIDEAFITSSSRGVVPVVKIDGLWIGSGTVGQFTQWLRQTYQAEMDKLTEPIKGEHL